MSAPVVVDDALLARWPLPMPAADGDKDERGRILLVGGSPQMPGAIMLAANAALRAGAGKLAVATARTVARLVAAQIPEAKVIALDEDGAGRLAPGSLLGGLSDMERDFEAVVIGPGFEGGEAMLRECAALAPRFGAARIVLDALAMECMPYLVDSGVRPDILLTPHAGEMARLSGASKEDILADPAAAAAGLAQRWQAAVALKGARTMLALPDGRLWEHSGGNIGLAVSGSGDTLAGIVGGLAARGAPLEQAAVWGVALHARAGDVLSGKLGPLGYLAREIADEVPALMHRLGAGRPG